MCLLRSERLGADGTPTITVFGGNLTASLNTVQHSQEVWATTRGVTKNQNGKGGVGGREEGRGGGGERERDRQRGRGCTTN